MNHEDKNSGHSSGEQDNESQVEIPELTQQIPVVDQVIPELTVRAEATVAQDENQSDAAVAIPELTQIYQSEQPEEPVDKKQTVPESYPLTTSQISDKELELQQWQIEQQAELQAHEWQHIAGMDSVTQIKTEPDTQLTDNNIVEEVELTEEQQALVDASWQRLESLIMEQMPIELAGIYLTLLEQQLDTNRAQIAEAIQLLEAETLESVLDYFHIERGF